VAGSAALWCRRQRQRSGDNTWLTTESLMLTSPVAATEPVASELSSLSTPSAKLRSSPFTDSSTRTRLPQEGGQYGMVGGTTGKRSLSPTTPENFFFTRVCSEDLAEVGIHYDLDTGLRDCDDSDNDVIFRTPIASPRKPRSEDKFKIGMWAPPRHRVPAKCMRENSNVLALEMSKSPLSVLRNLEKEFESQSVLIGVA